MIPEVKNLAQKLNEIGYIVEEELATVLLLTLKLTKPILLEGPPGVGKTDAAHIIANYLNTDLIRLQCYEGLDVNTSIYEWNYQKQLLSIKLNENSDLSVKDKEKHIFSKEFLMERPLLKAITSPKQVVLLIDEIDRADEEFEAFLLELLADFQISIPELGTIKAMHPPIVVLTSNRTRELSDALKRRCLYHWIDYPSFQKELNIVNKKFPIIDQQLASETVKFVEQLRQLNLQKSPGIAETLDWVNALLTLQVKEIDAEIIQKTLGCILKSEMDNQLVKDHGLMKLLDQINAE